MPSSPTSRRCSDEYVSPSRDTCSTTSWPLTTQKPPCRSLNATGHVRSSAHLAMRSSWNSVLWWSKSTVGRSAMGHLEGGGGVVGRNDGLVLILDQDQVAQQHASDPLLRNPTGDGQDGPALQDLAMAQDGVDHRR